MTQPHQPGSSLGLLLIHGAGTGAWIWDTLLPQLPLPGLAVDLPGREEPVQARKHLRLADYAESVVSQAGALDTEKVVVVTHSLGVVGLTVAHRLAERLAGFAAVAAVIPKNGSSFMSALPAPRRWITSAVVHVIGTKPPAAAIKKGLCTGLDKDRSDEILTRFTPEARAVYLDRTSVTLS